MSYTATHPEAVLDRLIDLLTQPRRQSLQPSEQAKLAALIAVAEDRLQQRDDQVRPGKRERISNL